MLGLVPPPGRVVGGSVRYRGEDVIVATPARLRRLRGPELAMVFQDPSAALNPLFTVERQLGDVLRAHRDWGRARVRRRVIEILEAVRFPSPERRMRAYPHELSGGLRQRVAIAMALICEPGIVIADEPTTNLDVSVQAQIIELLEQLRRELRVAIVFVTHDLALAATIADRVTVMYAGYAVENGPVEAVLEKPAHPYTRGLLASAPVGYHHSRKRLKPIAGQIPDLRTLGDSAPFESRCELAIAGVCDSAVPGWTQCGAGHWVACHRYAAASGSLAVAG